MRHARPRRTAGSLLADALDLVHPRECAGCGEPGASLCPACTKALRPGAFAHRPSPCPPGLPPAFAATAYAGPVRSAIVAWKERGARDLAAPMAGALADAVAAALLATEGAGPLCLVPVPASSAARRVRGEDIVARLSQRAAELLRREGWDARWRPALAMRGRPLDQASLGRVARLANLRDTMVLTRAASRSFKRSPCSIVIVDDVVTSGATLVEAARALRARGLPVRAAATVAATLRRG